MRILVPLLLGLSGLSFLGFGIAFLIAPRETLALAGVATEGAIAATELRAFYGGLWLTLCCYGAIGLTRVVGMGIDGSDSFFLRFAASTEAGFALAAALLLRLKQKA